MRDAEPAPGAAVQQQLDRQLAQAAVRAGPDQQRARRTDQRGHGRRQALPRGAAGVAQRGVEVGIDRGAFGEALHVGTVAGDQRFERAHAVGARHGQHRALGQRRAAAAQCEPGQGLRAGFQGQQQVVGQPPQQRIERCQGAVERIGRCSVTAVATHAGHFAGFAQRAHDAQPLVGAVRGQRGLVGDRVQQQPVLRHQRRLALLGRPRPAQRGFALRDQLAQRCRVERGTVALRPRQHDRVVHARQCLRKPAVEHPLDLLVQLQRLVATPQPQQRIGLVEARLRRIEQAAVAGPGLLVQGRRLAESVGRRGGVARREFDLAARELQPVERGAHAAVHRAPGRPVISGRLDVDDEARLDPADQRRQPAPAHRRHGPPGRRPWPAPRRPGRAAAVHARAASAASGTAHRRRPSPPARTAARCPPPRTAAAGGAPAAGSRRARKTAVPRRRRATTAAPCARSRRHRRSGRLRASPGPLRSAARRAGRRRRAGLAPLRG